MSSPRREFDGEFCDGAVRIVKETGRPVARVARGLGAGEGALGNWVRKDRAEQAGGCVVMSGPGWCGCARRTRLCRWSVMCSNDPQSFGLTR